MKKVSILGVDLAVYQGILRFSFRSAQENSGHASTEKRRCRDFFSRIYLVSIL
jgi:hypothetical protein